MPTDHLDDLRVNSRYARERYQLYRAKTHGPKPTSEARLRELQRSFEQAEDRLHGAEAEEQRAESAGDSRPNDADADRI